MKTNVPEHNHAAFVAERNDILICGDLKRFKSFYFGNGGHPVTDDSVLEIMFHKCRVELEELPAALREESKNWLTTHGFQPGFTKKVTVAKLIEQLQALPENIKGYDVLYYDGKGGGFPYHGKIEIFENETTIALV